MDTCSQCPTYPLALPLPITETFSKHPIHPYSVALETEKEKKPTGLMTYGERMAVRLLLNTLIHVPASPSVCLLLVAIRACASLL